MSEPLEQPVSFSEQLTEQFYRWELRGRGLQIWENPVDLEPPFRPFRGHYISQPREVIDDGRIPTFWSTVADKLLGKTLRGPTQPEALSEIEEVESEPEPIDSGDGLVELQASLPRDFEISKEIFEQFLLSLAYSRQPLGFEFLGVGNSITVQLTASEEDAGQLSEQLNAYFPEASFRSQSGFLERSWQSASNGDSLIVEFGLAREFMLPLATVKNYNVDPLIGIAGALAGLSKGEVGLVQVLFKPLRHPWAENIWRAVTDGQGECFFANAPEILDQTMVKLSRPLYAVVLRIATRGSEPGRAVQIATALAGAFQVFTNPQGNELTPLKNDEYDTAEHEHDLLLRRSRRSGMVLNTDELISLVHLPSPSVRSSRLRRDVSKTKSAPSVTQHSTGVVLGENLHAGQSRTVRLTAEQRVRHCHVIGASGTGKSTFLLNLIVQDIKNGDGVAVLDPHGDLVDKVIAHIPKERFGDVVLLDPSDEEFPVGFNILWAHSEQEKNLLESDLVAAFQRLSTSWGDQMTAVLGNAILAFLESSEGGTLADLRRFLIEEEYRTEFLKSVADPEVSYYWRKEFPLLRGKPQASVVTRLDTFLRPKRIRYMVCQKASRLDFADIMNTGKIFLARLSQGLIGEENAYLLGSVVVAKFHQMAMGRQQLEAAKRRDYWLYIDEFHNFVTPSLAAILSGARKYRLGLILAHQELRQIQNRDTEVLSAVLSNSGTRVCFRVGSDDARHLAKGLSFFEADDLQNLGVGEAICRVERNDYDFNLRVSPLPEIEAERVERARQEITARSRQAYSVPRDQVAAELRKGLEVSDETPKLPSSAQLSTPKVKVTQAPVPGVPPISCIGPEEEKSIEEKTKRKPTGSVEEAGRGGAQHQLIQKRIKAVAESLGYRASIEKEILGKQGSVDLVLEKASRTIACEISITTTIDHEIGNIVKCLKAGFAHVAVVSIDQERLAKIRHSVANCLPAEDAVKVEYYLPDKLIDYLQELAVREAPQVEGSNATSHGYKVKRTYAQLTEQERKQREEAILKAIAKKARPPKGKNE